MRIVVIAGFFILLINCLSFSTDTSTPNLMESKFLLNVLQRLEDGENVIFTKFGDGEYNCMTGRTDCNCDGDRYHRWLGDELKKALIELAQKPNCYIGRWWNAYVYKYCDALAASYGVKVSWCWYHLFMNDDDALKFDYMFKFVQFIQSTNRKKILVCNHANSRLKDFFNVDVLIEIPPKNWSFEYSKWRDILKQHLEENCIILIAGGMCSKVLINDITNEFNLTFIDLGCSFDQLGSKKNTRGWKHNFDAELIYYKDLLPTNWD